MSQLLTCWKRKPCPECQERAAAATAAATAASGAGARTLPLESEDPPSNEQVQQQVQQPMQQRLDIPQACAPAFLLRVQNGGSRRHEAEARLDEAWLVRDVLMPTTGAAAAAAEEEARRLDGRRAFCESLLGQINELRRSSSPGKPPLRPSSVLCRVAQKTWQRQAEQPQGLGFACLTDCCVNQVYPDRDRGGREVATGMVHDCLAYCDLPGHSKLHLPAAALHYWRTGGSFSAENAKQKTWQPETAELYPPQGSDASLQLDSCKGMFESILLDEENSCIGLYFNKARTEMEHAAWMYCVIAVFA